jgi:hypothetical protein
MALGTQRDQVVAVIGPQLTSPFDVMNLQVVSCAAILAAPAISLEHSSAELPVGFWLQPQPGSFLIYSWHEAF